MALEAVGLAVVVGRETDLVVGHSGEVSVWDVSVIVIVVGGEAGAGAILPSCYPVCIEQAVLDAGVSISAGVSGVDVEDRAVIIIVSD